MRKLVVSLALVAALAPAAALAGGWATVKLSSTPTGAQAGVPWVVDLTVLQHGQTPLADDPARRCRSPGHRHALVPRPPDGEDGRLPRPRRLPARGNVDAGRSGTASAAPTPTSR